ncbi:MAG: manganese-dependent inorganic pyrophosphatase [Clostridia bacterium]|nr:manganese-dependent inorganic pyrophosphatase [Clostridia bacterium]
MEEKNILIFGHKNPDTDSICSSLVMEKFDKNLGFSVEAVRLGEVNKETQYVLNYLNLSAPRLIHEVNEGQSVVLVDHNEFTQSANGIEKATIETVIDHHRIANFQTTEPLYYRAEPVGCTATILYKKFKELNMEIEKKEAVLMLSAIISDTLLFKSPTCTIEDKTACENLAHIANIDIDTYGLEMLKAGTDLSDFTPEELINLDSKEFINGDFKFQVAQVNTACIEDVLQNKVDIENAMTNFMTQNGSNLFILLITDILNSNSQSIVLGDTTIFEKAFSKPVENNLAFLEGVVSRKKQVAPVILNALT